MNTLQLKISQHRARVHITLYVILTVMAFALLFVGGITK